LMLQGRIKQINFKSLFGCLVSAIVASLFMAIFVYILQGFAGVVPFRPIPLTGDWVNATFSQHLLFLLLTLVTAVVIYGSVGRFLGLRELEQIQEQIWKRLRQTKGKS